MKKKNLINKTLHEFSECIIFPSATAKIRQILECYISSDKWAKKMIIVESTGQWPEKHRHTKSSFQTTK